MNPRRTTWLALGLGTWLAACPPARAGVEAELSRLAWLEGHWLGTQGDTATEEHWSSPAGGALVGMHKDVARGRLTGFEFLRIAASDAGRVCYFASPNGAARRANGRRPATHRPSWRYRRAGARCASAPSTPVSMRTTAVSAGDTIRAPPPG